MSLLTALLWGTVESCIVDVLQYNFASRIPVISKAGPAVLIRIRINTVFVLNTSYCVFEPYLPYLTVEKYDFLLKYVFPKICINMAYFTFIYGILAASRIVLWVWPLHG